jgi:signal transduction histidine kinase
MAGRRPLPENESIMVPASLRTSTAPESGLDGPTRPGLIALVLLTGVAAVFGIVVLGGRVVLGAPTSLLILVAAVVTAVTYEPARQRLARIASERTKVVSPWQAVARLASALGDGRDPEETLRVAADVIAEGTTAEQVVVGLTVGDRFRPVVVVPEGAMPPGIGPSDDLPSGADGVPDRLAADLPGDLVVPLRVDGRVVGAICVTAGRRGLLPREERLVRDIAAGAGLAAGTLRLREGLRRRVEEARVLQERLGRSRARVVAAQDEERRRVAADIHDSCQQRAAVVAGKLGLARSMAEAGAPALELVTINHEVDVDLDRLSQALSAITRGTGIPQLDRGGVAAALELDTADLGTEVAVQGRMFGRQATEVESAVYYCCMEAVQNAVRHGRASTVRVHLDADESSARFLVADDGAGFDVEHTREGAGLVNMRGRLEELGGSVAVESAPTGTVVAGRVPARSRR